MSKVTKSYIQADIRVQFRTPFHLGAGFGDVSINRIVKRTADRRPYVPASALKGALRMAAERVVQVVNRSTAVSFANRLWQGEKPLEQLCRTPKLEDMCQSKTPCLICRLFGNVFTGNRLFVDDAYADESDLLSRLYDKTFGENYVPLVSRETITRAQIDRQRRGAKKGALFSSEYTPTTQQTFRSRLSGMLFLTQLDGDIPPLELILLAASVAFVEHIGAEVSIGRGHCDVIVDGDKGGVIDVSGKPYSVHELIDHIEYIPFFERV